MTSQYKHSEYTAVNNYITYNVDSAKNCKKFHQRFLKVRDKKTKKREKNKKMCKTV